jgi:hypothetical protein
LSKKGYTAEQIINRLREAEVLLSQGADDGSSMPATGDNRPDLLPVAEAVWRDEGRPRRGRTARSRGTLDRLDILAYAVLEPVAHRLSPPQDGLPPPVVLAVRWEQPRQAVLALLCGLAAAGGMWSGRKSRRGRHD